jgi:hypothetical protein
MPKYSGVFLKPIDNSQDFVEVQLDFNRFADLLKARRVSIEIATNWLTENVWKFGSGWNSRRRWNLCRPALGEEMNHWKPKAEDERYFRHSLHYWRDYIKKREEELDSLEDDGEERTVPLKDKFEELEDRIAALEANKENIDPVHLSIKLKNLAIKNNFTFNFLHKIEDNIEKLVNLWKLQGRINQIMLNGNSM